VTSQPIRDPIADHLLTPQNSAFLFIDYQPPQFSAVKSMNRDLMMKNAISTIKLVQLFGVPIVYSSVNVQTGLNQPTLQPFAELLQDETPVDRTSVNSWEDVEFVQAVHATGRRKLIICALWTEICMAFTALDALREGYEVYPVVDAIGGTLHEAHRSGMKRVIQAGAQPNYVGLAVQRATARLGSHRNHRLGRGDRSERAPDPRTRPARARRRMNRRRAARRWVRTQSPRPEWGGLVSPGCECPSSEPRRAL
jgi:nicotinamidase-related amidase